MSAVFGQNLALTMIEKEWTQTKLAKALGTSQQSVSRWIKNQAEPNFETLLEICYYLDETPNYLLGYDEIDWDNYEIQHTLNSDYNEVKSEEETALESIAEL
jgi:transcriptional regulator with XRE-family HTH domain